MAETPQPEETREEWLVRMAQHVTAPVEPLPKGPRPITGGTCPKCGGTSFVVRRKRSTKLAFGLASMLGKAKHVECVTCGTLHKRG
ncbi:MAG: hypothetical protein WDA60_00010 [Acidimicrobiia bacterium]